MRCLCFILVIWIALSLTACGNWPIYENQWQPYKATEYSTEVQIAICGPQAQVASLDLKQKLEAQYAEKRQACVAAANAASTTTVNVYGNNTTYNNGRGLSGGLDGTKRAIASFSCNTTATDNLTIGYAVANAIGAHVRACMAESGFMLRKVCVKNCNTE